MRQCRGGMDERPDEDAYRADDRGGLTFTSFARSSTVPTSSLSACSSAGLLKVGVDAGTPSRPPFDGHHRDQRQGGDPRADADVVVYAASKAFASEHQHRRHRRAADVGQERHHHHFLQSPADLRRRRRRRASAGACRSRSRPLPRRRRAPRLHVRTARGTSRSPRLSQRVDRITVQEFVDRAPVSRARRCCIDLMGMGKRPEDISVESPMFRAVSVQYEQAIGSAATAGGPQPRARRDPPLGPRPATVDHDVDVAIAGTLPRRFGRRSDHVVERVPRRRAGAGGPGVLDCHRRHPRVGPRPRADLPRTVIRVEGVPHVAPST